MVRYKNRYFVVEFERARTVEAGVKSVDLEPLNSDEKDLTNAIKERIQDLHGDFGRAAISVGFKVSYVNKDTRMVLIRARHGGPDKIVSSALPFVTSVKKEGVIGRLLYTGATIRHSYMFMKKRQTARLAQLLKQMAKDPSMDPALLEEKLLQLRQVES